jgi:hypothetical protein
MMSSSPVLSSVLTHLSRIARAPMTEPERRLRAESFLTGDVTLEMLVSAVARADLEWNRQQAANHKIDETTWLQALHVADVMGSQSLSALIDRLHKAEAVASILKAGYQPEQSSAGFVVWSPR